MRPKDTHNENSLSRSKRAEAEARKRREQQDSWPKQPDPFDGYSPRSPYSSQSTGPKRKPSRMPNVPQGGKRKPSWTQTWI